MAAPYFINTRDICDPFFTQSIFILGHFKNFSFSFCSNSFVYTTSKRAFEHLFDHLSLTVESDLFFIHNFFQYIFCFFYRHSLHLYKLLFKHIQKKRRTNASYTSSIFSTSSTCSANSSGVSNVIFPVCHHEAHNSDVIANNSAAH